MNKNKLFSLRAAIITIYAACIFFAAYVLIKNPFKSDFYAGFSHDKTLFHCPTCGATRALYCLLTLNFKGAFYYHAYFTVFSPVFLYIAAALGVNLFFQKKIIPYPKRSDVFLYALLFLLVAFTFFRNFTSVVY